MTVKRMTFLQELLKLIGLGGRLHLSWISSAEAQKYVQVVTDFTEKIRTLGPNPLPMLAKHAKEGRIPEMNLANDKGMALKNLPHTNPLAKCA
jgi:methyl-viologen-reducing hydrogenase delta subunit